MPKTKVELCGEVHICFGQTYTVVDALEALKCIGIAYGLYDHAEEFDTQRVILDESGERPVLAVQENLSQDGSPLWNTYRTITDDPQQIQQYMAFRDTLKMINEMEHERRRQPSPVKPQSQRKGGKTHER